MNNQKNGWIKNFFGKTIYFYLSVLISVPFFIVTETYVRSIGVHEDEAVAVAITAFFIIGVFTGRYLGQLLLLQNKKIHYRLPAALAMLIIALVAWLFFHADFPLQHRVAINLMLSWIPFAIISIATGMLIKLVHDMSQRQLREAQFSAANSQSELQLLQSQLSPHFLFNTLNNLYGLSITQHEKIPPLLLRLSDLLRYAVYDAKEVFVTLKDELNYINNYIEFEKIRMGERLELTTAIEPITNTDIRIAPMLLIVFIENAFKHSKNTNDEKVFIHIDLKTWGNYILFSIKNSHSDITAENNILDKNSGLGLVNVTKRLELLYPNQYALELDNKDGFYSVMLQLKHK